MLPRKESRGGLRKLFQRSKVDNLTVTPEEVHRTHSAHQSSTRHLNANPSRNGPSKGIQHSLVATQASSLTPTGSTSSPAHKTRKSNAHSATSTTVNRRPPRQIASLDPLPYFQAIPQAIKYAHLPASTLSADTIIRSNCCGSGLRQADVAPRNIAVLSEGSTSATTASREKSKTRSRGQKWNTVAKAPWTRKVFALTSTGFLLQFSEDGSFDRLPEKMLQLGKDSVAFASDVIPGRHWVLQVSQRMDSDGAPASDARSLFSRLTSRTVDHRRTAISLLLVLNNATEMDAWLAILRREIEALGGEQSVSETGRPGNQSKVIQLCAQPSQGKNYGQDDTQSGDQSPVPPKATTDSSILPTPSGPPTPWSVAARFEECLYSADSILARPSSAHSSTDHRSVSNSAISNDSQQLEQVRHGTNRLSYMSTGQTTLPTSAGTTPTASPTCESVSTIGDLSYVSFRETYNVEKPRKQTLKDRSDSIRLPGSLPLESPGVSMQESSTRSNQAQPTSPPPNFSFPIAYRQRSVTATASAPLPLRIMQTAYKGPNEWHKSSRDGRKPEPLKLHSTPYQNFSGRIVRSTPTGVTFDSVSKTTTSIITMPPIPSTLVSQSDMQSRSTITRSGSLSKRKSFSPPGNLQQQSIHRRFSSIDPSNPITSEACSLLSNEPTVHMGIKRNGSQVQCPKPTIQISEPGSTSTMRCNRRTSSPRPKSLDLHNTSRRSVVMERFDTKSSNQCRPKPFKLPVAPPLSFTRNMAQRQRQSPDATVLASAPDANVRQRTTNQIVAFDIRRRTQGPPIAPPPDCALPPLPAVFAGR